MTRRYALDASVGVKWFKQESGSERARELLQAQADGDAELVCDAVFAIEVLEVVRRRNGTAAAHAAWQLMRRAFAPSPSAIAGADVGALLGVAERLGCSLYDATAALLAERTGATLVSADERAHGSVPGVELLG